MFIPKLVTVFKEGYSKDLFVKDLIAGVIVGVVALPLAIAFAIASGVSPEKGLVTAIIAGFIISAFGGSRVQIGGPTGAFIIIVFGIVAKYGVSGLTVATFIAGFIIIILGITKLGSVIKYIPQSVIVGFTSGIALIIFSTQIKDFFGLQMESVPSDFIEKWGAYFRNIHTINYYAVIITITTIAISVYLPRITKKIPGSLVAIILSTLVVSIFNLPVDTIYSNFGDIPANFPKPSLPVINFKIIKELIEPAFAIALLGSIESLLSAVVADGMTGGRHRSNMELIAQGAANIVSSIFGGIPATGAIARTATNIKNGGKTPVAGIVHAITLLLIMLFVGKWAKLIPMASLAGILIVVAYNMSEYKSFFSLARGPRSDAVILFITFGLTVMVDLVIALEIGMVLAAFLFMKKMADLSHINEITDEINDVKDIEDPEATGNYIIPKGVEIYEVNGPLFFGAAYKFRDALKLSNRKPQVVIIRMRYVPTIDATGLHHLKEIAKDLQHKKIKIIISGIQPEVYKKLEKSRIVFLIGKRNIKNHIKLSIDRANEIIASSGQKV
ncbi:MAG: sulfate permease [Bacteroidales bacterium]|nr:sulfate permease [Bacteroidales bacterium]